MGFKKFIVSKNDLKSTAIMLLNSLSLLSCVSLHYHHHRNLTSTYKLLSCRFSVTRRNDCSVTICLLCTILVGQFYRVVSFDNLFYWNLFLLYQFVTRYDINMFLWNYQVLDFDIFSIYQKESDRLIWLSFKYFKS